MADRFVKTLDKRPNARGKFPPLHFAALAQLLRDLGGDIARPPLSSVEANDPNRIFVLATQQAGKDGLVIRRFRIGLAPDSAEPAEIVYIHPDHCLARWKGTEA